jgi:hypothetical protein
MVNEGYGDVLVMRNVMIYKGDDGWLKKLL